MKIIRLTLKDSLITTGILFIIISLFFFCLPMVAKTEVDSYFGLFMLNFFFSVTYFILLLARRSAKQESHKRHYSILLLVLFLISAYSLNREIEVFNTSTNWLAVLLVVICCNYISSLFFIYTHNYVRHCIFVVFGISAVLFLYLSIYVMPLYIFSIVALPALAISIHTFVPFLLLLYTFLLADDFAKEEKKYWLSFAAGVLISIAVVLFYCFTWNANIKSINKAYNQSLMEAKSEMPSWIQVAQKIPHNRYAEDILKTGLVYKTHTWGDNMFWNMPNRNFDEGRQYHDPLIVLASLFSGSTNLSEEDRINILKSQFNARHQAEEKLWSGKDLETQNVVTNVRVWPQFHIAYTEKIITVYNHSTTRWQGSQQEALYSFQLPEGSVVTSLSLWINGQEETGILTTKGKADTAYKTIVGVESRDPSVVHWQEGNRVTVRVFPVLANNSRVFKIGITSPLKKEGSNLLYENIFFEGPKWDKANETVKVEFDRPADIIQKVNLNEEKNVLRRSGYYKQDWRLVLKDKGLSPDGFYFNGYTYVLQPVQTQALHWQLSNVYLDLNKAWTKAEVKAVLKKTTDKRVWVYQNRFIELKDEKEEIVGELLSQNFSFFPFHLISDTEHSLVITKSEGPSPNLLDMGQSKFLAQLRFWSREGKKIPLFNLNSSAPAYLKALKEHRFFYYQSGDLGDIQKLLKSGTFHFPLESSDRVVVEEAGMAIVKTKGMAVTKAPDHLMRLFTYNHIMMELGQKGFSGAEAEDELIEEASESNIVSPVSSLVVLEKQEDYERFNIEASKNGLNNASLHSKGAVPEPHEWLLILLTVGFAVYLYTRLKL